jgi:hypothetical protein
MTHKQIASDIIAAAPTNDASLKGFDYFLLMQILEKLLPILLSCIQNRSLSEIKNPGFLARARLRLLLWNNVDYEHRAAIHTLLNSYAGKLTVGRYNELVKKTS